MRCMYIMWWYLLAPIRSLSFLSPSLPSLALINDGKVDHTFTQEFFNVGYTLMYLTSIIPKPYIAIIDGITMGGVSLTAY